MKLNPFENSRSFYSRSKGTTKTVRDTYTKQTNPKIEEVKKVNKNTSVPKKSVVIAKKVEEKVEKKETKPAAKVEKKEGKLHKNL